MDIKDPLIKDIEQCRKGDSEAMERVYRRYIGFVYNLGYRFSGSITVAEDLMQEVFIKAFINIGSLRSARAFKSWLSRIAVNTCLSYARKHKVDAQQVPLEDIPGACVAESATVSLSVQLQQAMDCLPPKQKMVFILHDVEGFNHKEIAAHMKSTVGTCKSQLFKARVKLRESLEGLGS